MKALKQHQYYHFYLQYIFSWLEKAHCAAPFVEHFPIKEIYYKSTKDKGEMIFLHGVSFCNIRLNSSILNVIKNILEQKIQRK